MADFVFVNYEVVPGDVVTNGSPVKIGNGIVINQGSAIVRNNENELNLLQGGFYLVNYTITNFNSNASRVETVLNLRNSNVDNATAIGPQSNGVAFASTTAIVQAFSGINNILKIMNHSNNDLIQGARVNLTILKLT